MPKAKRKQPARQSAQSSRCSPRSKRVNPSEDYDIICTVTLEHLSRKDPIRPVARLVPYNHVYTSKKYLHYNDDNYLEETEQTEEKEVFEEERNFHVADDDDGLDLGTDNGESSSSCNNSPSITSRTTRSMKKDVNSTRRTTRSMKKDANDSSSASQKKGPSTQHRAVDSETKEVPIRASRSNKAAKEAKEGRLKKLCQLRHLSPMKVVYTL